MENTIYFLVPKGFKPKVYPALTPIPLKQLQGIKSFDNSGNDIVVCEWDSDKGYYKLKQRDEYSKLIDTL